MPYGEAFDLARKLNLAGFMELSSIDSNKVDIDDAFMICGITAIDETTARPFYQAGKAGVKPAVITSEYAFANDSINN